ncbi:aldose epimerase family protein [uncultured Serinicoccus sp.]|uniref:aldose epimerase family protein n=1 Tax=uncultured Serinicoccus sp. TaxID=735514 RepID=UPI002628CD5C|nr:aldose epimerase family protein [uncultured Serinicoccus sp.]
MPTPPPGPTTVTLTASGIRVDLLSTGAAIARVELTDGHGDGPVDVVLGHADLADYGRVRDFQGATIGRVANRIDGGRFRLGDRAVEVPLDPDEPHALHGGPEGFDRREWALVEATDDRATWSLTSPDGDQGFPGEVEVEVRYAVTPGRLTVEHRATTSAPTPVSLTNHSYWNLDGEGAGEILDHTLQVDADTYLPVRPDQIPTGEVRDVAGSPFDLRRPVVLGEALAADDAQLRIGQGFDHHLVVPGEGLRRHAVLVGGSGRRMEVWSDRPGLQVYAGAHFDGTVTGPRGVAYGPRAGIALETQAFPDAVNQPRFPSVVLHPGQTYASTTEWRFS